MSVNHTPGSLMEMMEVATLPCSICARVFSGIQSLRAGWLTPFAVLNAYSFGIVKCECVSIRNGRPGPADPSCNPDIVFGSAAEAPSAAICAIHFRRVNKCMSSSLRLAQLLDHSRNIVGQCPVFVFVPFCGQFSSLVLAAPWAGAQLIPDSAIELIDFIGRRADVFQQTGEVINRLNVFAGYEMESFRLADPWTRVRLGIGDRPVQFQCVVVGSAVALLQAHRFAVRISEM